MSEETERYGTTTFKAALGRLTAGWLALFEYLLAVGTMATLLLTMQTGISTVAAVINATVPPRLVAIHLRTEWEKRNKSRKDDA